MNRNLEAETASKSEAFDDNKEMEIDTALKHVGPISKFGTALLALGFFIQLFADYNIVLSFFTGHNPAWRCVSTNTSSKFCLLNKNTTFTSNKVSFSQRCHLNRSEWEYTTSKDYSFVTEYDLVCSKLWISALNNAMFHLGGIISAACIGTFADKFGRKPAIAISLVIILFSSLISSSIDKIWFLLTVNVFLGIGHAAYQYSLTVYLIETSHPSFKSLVVNVMGLGGSLSFLLIDLYSYLLPIWRPVVRYASLPSILMIAVIFIFPESPRWLLATKKKQLAEEVLTKVAFFNDKTSEVHIRLKSKEAMVTKTYTYVDLVRRWKLARLTLSLSCIFFVVPILFYAIALQTNFNGSIYKTFAFSTVADVPAIFLGSWLLEKIGRKKYNLGGLIISGILFGCLYLVPQSKPYSYALDTTIAFITRLFICLTFIRIFIWAAELYPTVLRAQGLCLCGVVDRCGMFFIPFLINILQNYIHRGTFLIMASLAIIAFLVGLTIPETKGKPLTESYEDFIKENNGIENRGLDNCNS